MIDCVLGSRAAQRASVLDQMFQRRYDLFVRTRGWRGLGSDTGMERDRFDTEHAIYLLSVDTGDILTGSLRLLPTTGPHLLSESFPHLAPHGVPRGRDVLEMTRYFTIRDRTRSDKMRRAAGELLCAMFEFALANRIAWITTLFDTFFLPRMRQNGWGETLLGDPMPYDEGIAVAIKIPVSQDNLLRTRHVHGIGQPVLHLGDEMPSVGQTLSSSLSFGLRTAIARY